MRTKGAPESLAFCGGVFVLAASGLLTNKCATTHWRFLDQLVEQFPKVQTCGASLYCDDNRVLTSAGSSAGIDLCLHIVQSDYGDQVAEQVAERLLFPKDPRWQSNSTHNSSASSQAEGPAAFGFSGSLGVGRREQCYDRRCG